MTGPNEYLKAIIDLLGRNDVEEAYQRVRQFVPDPARPEPEIIQSLVKAIRHAYLHLVVMPVHIFLRGAPEALSLPLGEPLRTALEAQLQKTDEWRTTVRALARERYARETRALIRSKRLRDAAFRIQGMVELSKEDPSPQSVIGYLATTLGTLDHDQDQVDLLMDAMNRGPERFGLTSELVITLDAARKDQFNRMGGMALEGREREFNRVFTQAVVDLHNRLMVDYAVGEPTEEETAKFFEELHGLFRGALMLGRPDCLLDVIGLLVELTPRDRRAIGPAVQSEERLFLSLNPRQRLIVVRALRRLGEIPRAVSLVLKLARSPEAAEYGIGIVEVMGGLGSREFYPFINECYQDSHFADPRFSCIDTLGRIQHEAALDLLLKRFAQLVRAKPFDPPKRREAEAISTALGRISRSRNVSVQRRNEIVAQVVALIPESDTQMGFRAARDLFTFQPQNLDERLLAWSMGRVVQALWSQDQRPEFARAAEGTRAVLGFRQDIVDLAVQIGSRAQGALLTAVEPYVTRFSGAFFALAEILERIGDEHAMAVLKRLVTTAWMSSDESGSKYYQETFYDSATQTTKPMTRDKIIHALIYTISKIGGIEGRRFLVEMAQQVRSKQLDMPGDETGAFLMQQFIDHGKEVAEERSRLEEHGEDPSEVSHPLGRMHVHELSEILRARYLMTNARRTKKIPVIQEIARRRCTELLDLLVQQLSDKDTMVRAAAATAILDFGAPGAREATLKALGQLLMDRIAHSKDEEREEARNLLRKLNPRREPFKAMILRAWETAGEGGLKSELSRIIRLDGLFGGENSGGDGSATDFFQPSTPVQAAPAVEKAELSKAQALFEARRAYLQARRVWIEGGKKGEPPDPPDESSI